MMAILSAQNLMHRKGDKVILEGINLAVQSGDIYGILGPNGAGKTTLFKLLVGLLHPSQGRIVLDEQEITHCDLAQRSKLGLIYLPQEPSIFPGLTVEENLIVVAECAQPQTRDKVDTMLDALQLNALRSQKAETLSGGQRRRVEIARSLLLHPKFILLDEPFAGIDPIAIADIKRILKDLASQSIGIIVTDHQVRETLSLCTKAAFIRSSYCVKAHFKHF